MIRDRILELRRVKASDLRPHPRNWRRHPPGQVSALQSMLQDVGYADAVLARETPAGLELIDGHLRASLDPEETVPVLVVDLDDDEALKVLTTLDPLSAMADSDEEMLAELLAEVEISSADLLRHLGVSEAKAPSNPDAVVEAPTKPKTKLGDLWVLGEHRLLCGDATNPADVAKVLGEAKPALCVTDPPYGVDYDPSWRNEAAEKGQLAYAPTRIGTVSNDDRTDWSEAWLLHPGAVIYCWSPAGSSSLVSGAALLAAGFEIRNQIMWSKPHFPIGRGHYHYRHEPCWYAVRKGGKAGWIGDRKQTTVWEITLDPNVEGGHSTQKPVECMERAIRNHSGDVYDPFVGSGTTIIAAERQERTCYAIDIDPAYCDVSVKRWEQYTGEKARRG